MFEFGGEYYLNSVGPRTSLLHRPLELLPSNSEVTSDNQRLTSGQSVLGHLIFWDLLDALKTTSRVIEMGSDIEKEQQ